MAKIDHPLGGGGAYPALYFLTRCMRPACVVETGVAAGFSSCSVLAALEANGEGRLYSSDFPYFRLPNPEQYVGVVVDEPLKKNWRLYLDGDDANLPRIVDSVDRIDLFHYDSDKSYSGRQAALEHVKGALSEEAVIVFDDIQDNSHFRDLVEETRPESWRVFRFQGKYVGMIGKPQRLAA
ncbi:MAG: class I SAM-dependent methyltransferase [Planctomycetota bacterium]